MQVLTDFPLKDILSYAIGGKAKTVLKVCNTKDLEEAFDYLKKHATKRILPIGMGANLLMTDELFEGVIVWFAEPQKGIVLHENGLIEAFASVTLDEIIQFSFANHLIGLEWAGGLPSTIGAAVRGNVGCFGHEIKDIVEKVEIFDLADLSFKFKDLNKEELEFGYRNSLLKKNKNLIVSRVWLKLKSATPEEILEAKKIYQANIDYRNKNHPMEYPSCGSVFKNIVNQEEVEAIMKAWPDIAESVLHKWHGKVSMGYVIKRLGLSGYRVGGAQVSEKHCNYISNIDNAKFEDVYTIIKLIQQKFFESFGFYPEPEVEIISD